jgi:DNA-directed RNA polymerase specialized sigma24 family protein
MKKSTYHVKPKRFTELLIAVQETGSAESEAALVQECLYPLCAGVCRKLRITGVDEEDIIQQCVIHCWKNIHKFNVERETVHPTSSGDPSRKAFSFFTTCAMNVARGIRRKANNVAMHLEDIDQDLMDYLINNK